MLSDLVDPCQSGNSTVTALGQLRRFAPRAEGPDSIDWTGCTWHKSRGVELKLGSHWTFCDHDLALDLSQIQIWAFCLRHRPDPEWSSDYVGVLTESPFAVYIQPLSPSLTVVLLQTLFLLLSVITCLLTAQTSPSIALKYIYSNSFHKPNNINDWLLK